MTEHMKKDRSISKSRAPVLVELQGCKKLFQHNVNMCFIWLIHCVVYNDKFSSGEALAFPKIQLHLLQSGMMFSGSAFLCMT